MRLMPLQLLLLSAQILLVMRGDIDLLLCVQPTYNTEHCPILPTLPRRSPVISCQRGIVEARLLVANAWLQLGRLGYLPAKKQTLTNTSRLCLHAWGHIPHTQQQLLLSTADM